MCPTQIRANTRIRPYRSFLPQNDIGMKLKVYLNGIYLDEDHAQIPITDRSYLAGSDYLKLSVLIKEI